MCTQAKIVDIETKKTAMQVEDEDMTCLEISRKIHAIKQKMALCPDALPKQKDKWRLEIDELEGKAITSAPASNGDFAAKFLILKEMGINEDLGRVLELDALRISGLSQDERELEAIHIAWKALGECINSKALDDAKADELYKVSADLERQAANISAKTARALALKIQLCEGELTMREGAIIESTWSDIERLTQIAQ